jgi:sugar/nucleoside kinase (ribokinase family)
MIDGSDLLVIGGLSVDRFPDGWERAGGSVVHAARALAMAGLHAATITVAGPEEAAAAGVRMLRSFGPLLLRGAPRSIRFLIDEGRPLRVVTYEGGAHLPISPADVARFPAPAVLIAPIAAELHAADVVATAAASVRVAALQGWMRVLVPGEPVGARPLTGLAPELIDALRSVTALVASDEDLASVAPEARGAVTALRYRLGPHPILLVTSGQSGALLDLPDGRSATVPASVAVSGVSTIGAGDAFAALFAVGLGRGIDPLVAARDAAAGVSRWLAEWAGTPGG